jgi:hypothetical protein
MSQEQTFVKSNQSHHFTPTNGVELYFEGSKSYWKLRANIDILIVCHTANHCVEVVVFDPERNIEGNRLYLNSILLASKVDQQELQTKLNEKKETLIRQKKVFNVTILMKELLIQSIVNYILLRLHIETLTENKFIITLSSQTDDVTYEGVLDVVYPQIPPLLIPVHCHFAKKFKSADINSALKNLKTEELALKSATRLAELATTSVDGFKLMLAEKMRLEQEMRSRYSAARLRWIRAINRVLIQNYVQKVRGRLISLGMMTDEGDITGQGTLSQIQTQTHAIHSHIPPIHHSRRTRNKTIRRTIDNSMLAINGDPNNLSADGMTTTYSLPSIALSPQQQAQSQTQTQQIQAQTSALTSHGLLTKRRERSNKAVRRSLNNEMFQSVLNNKEKQRSPSFLWNNPDGSAPTLMQSYNQVSQRIDSNTPIVMLSELKNVGVSTQSSFMSSQKLPALVKD